MRKLFYVVAVVMAVFAFGVSNAHAVQLDLSEVTDQGSIAGNTGYFSRFSESGQGTGNFDSFLRIQGGNNDTDDDATTEFGYNTDGTVEFETKVDPHTHAIEISDIPTVEIEGVLYKEFALDAAEPSGNTLVIDVIEIYLLSAPDITNYAVWSAANTPKYVLDTPGDNSLLIDNITGNGVADLFVYVPVSAFTGTNTWVYFYTEMSSATGSFEEWGVRVGVVCTENCDPVVPEPTSMILFGTGLVGAVLRKRFIA